MVPRSILALALFASPSAAQEPDRLLIAICSKSFEELKQTIAGAAARGATLDVPEDADHETLMAALYTKSQGEIPGGGDARPWPGCDGVPKKAAPRFGGAKKQEPAAAAKKPEDMLDQMATMLFKTRDADKDGKLSAEEMKTILDQTNAKAKAAGEPEIDFLKAADKGASAAVHAYTPSAVPMVCNAPCSVHHLSLVSNFVSNFASISQTATAISTTRRLKSFSALRWEAQA